MSWTLKGLVPLNVAADVLDVEWDQPLRQRRVDECAGGERHRLERAVVDVDSAERGIGGIKARLGAVDRQPGIDGPEGARHFDKRRRGRVPGGNGSFQIGEYEMRVTAVSATHREARGVGIVDLARRALGARGPFPDRDQAAWAGDT